MKGFSRKTRVLRCLLAVLFAVLLFTPNVAEAADSIAQGTTKSYSVPASGKTISVSLTGAYTSVALQGKPNWVACSGSGSSRTLTVNKNTGAARSGDVVFRDGTKLWTIRISQSAGNLVTVKFDNNGGYGNVPSQTYTIGQKYGSLPAGSTPPTGKRFDGWYTAKSGGTKITTSSTVSASYTTLYAHYSAKTMYVSFNSNGGSSVSKKQVTYGSTYGSLTSPTKTGYNFQGWYTSSSGGSKVTSSTTVTATSDHTLYAHWSAKSFTVSFNSNGGSSVSSKTVTYNSTYGTLPTPTRNGYHFQGWYTAASGGTKITSSTKVTITSNQTLYAHWTGASILVQFDNNGGYGNVPSQTYTVGSTYGSLPAGSTAPNGGYMFEGWYTAKTGGTKITTGTTVSPSYTTLYAHYKAKTFQVSFNSNGGTTVATKITVTYGSAYGTLPAAPTRTGYTFVGWYTAANGGTRVVSSSTVNMTVDHTLYAHWEPKKYTITFNSNGGSTVSSKTVTYDSTYGTLANPTKTGYTFLGWFTASSGGTQVTAATKVKITANQTLYAHWKGASITVKFDNNGGYGNVPSQTYVVDSTYGKLPAGSTPPTGYAFAGWYTAKSGGIKITTSTKVSPSYMTLYAHYSPKNFTVSFNSQLGSSVKDQTVTYNSTYGTLPTPTRTGYNFDGWYTAAGGGTKVTASTKVTTAANHTLYAHWIAKNFTITFNSMGGSAVSSKTVKYNSSYGTLTTPTRTGYDFQGWYTAAAGGTKITASTKVTITANQTLFAQWKGKSITVKFDNNGGYGNVPSQTYTVGTTYGKLPAGSTPPNGGYAFEGWYSAKSGGTKVTTTSAVNYSWGTLYAHYKAKSFTLSFNSNGGVAISKQMTITYDSTYGTLPVPTRNYYEFTGWYTAASGGTKITSSTKVTTTVNQTLYAHWKRKTVTVKFDNNGGYGNVPSQTYNVGDKYGSLPTGSTPPAGYTFGGWYTAKSGGTKITINSTVSEAVTTLYAQYVPKILTVKFNSKGGSTVTEIKVTFGSTYPALKSPTKSGYLFDGWYTAESGGTKVVQGTKVTTTCDHTLYARWKTSKNYTVTFSANYTGGSSSYATRTVNFGGTYGSLPSAPSRKDFVFDGWYTEARGGSKVSATTIVNKESNHMLYAHWKVTVCFPDTWDSDLTVTGQEGCTITIPTKVLRALDTGNSSMIGWSMRMGVAYPDNGDLTTYQLPTNLDSSNVALYAVVSGQVAGEIPEFVRKKITSWLSNRWDPSINYSHNQGVQNSLGTSYLSGQREGNLAKLTVGDNKSFADVGCGPLAIYNALVFKEKRKPIADIIYLLENKGYLMSVSEKKLNEIRSYLNAFLIANPMAKKQVNELLDKLSAMANDYKTVGSFGTNYHKVGDVLSNYGVSTKSYSNSKSFADTVYDALGTDKGFVMCTWNYDGIGSAHFRFFCTSKTDKNHVIVYNNYSSSKSDESLTYEQFLEILGMNTGDNDANAKNRFLIGYELK